MAIALHQTVPESPARTFLHRRFFPGMAFGHADDSHACIHTVDCPSCGRRALCQLHHVDCAALYINEYMIPMHSPNDEYREVEVS